MDALMLEGWTPILLFGIVFAVGIFIVSRKVSRIALFSISVVLSLLCIGVVTYSVVGVEGWEGMGIGFVTVSVFLGIWVGTLIGATLKRSN
ncbi:YesK-like protein [Lentibacillus persicus]|uniref:YesK-like protein n=1 Tax=Lentibacillus persicus TaxID=640948 RepID=A0A1I1WYM1_9BACI|nr:YesK family protein [Lentibacillus persicus]SFE00162.1 YesK-like protein [Lentibacillus persicus]